MKWKKWLDEWGMSSLSVNTGILNMKFEPQDEDKDAAWELYIEMLTRITTQPLKKGMGDEKVALDSIYSLFPTTREIIKRKGRHCISFTKIAILVLNQKVRPFTEKWHKLSLNKVFDDKEKCKEFRKDLEILQKDLKIFMKMLSSMADVEDLTNLESI
jgi:hypothetical protein